MSNKDVAATPSGPQTGQQSQATSLSEVAEMLRSQKLQQAIGAGDAIPSAVSDLLNALGSGNVDLVQDAIVRLGASRDSELFTKVGKMARTLHDSMTEFKSSLDRDNLNMSNTNIPDAADKLQAVIQMTFDAANKTMSLAEKEGDFHRASRKDLESLEVILKNPKTAPDVMRKAALEFSARERSRVLELEKISSELVLAQAFQDLTGQALKKVILLVTEIEKNLVSLIQIFGHNEEPKMAENSAPTTLADGKSPTSLKQDDVDDILSSFGF